jgi:hypothetical protein
MSDESDSGFAAVMPFVTVSSVGGQHDDDAYVAGWEMGALYSRLGVAAEAGALPDAAVVQSNNAAQADLSAMRHGFTTVITVFEEQPEWSRVEFGRASA